MISKGFKEKAAGDVTILTVEKPIKGVLESLLRDRIDQLVRQGHLRIVVNLEQVPYVDSSDIGRIIRAHHAARHAGGRVRLCNLADRVKKVLKMTRLDTVLDIYDTEEEAVAGIVTAAEPQQAALHREPSHKGPGY